MTTGGGTKGGLQPWEADGSLGDDLSSVVDEAQQLVADLGLRPYRVFSIVEQWSGGKRGRGTVSIVSEREFTPPPVINYRPLRRQLGSAGVVERGEVTLERISTRYTEEEIRSLVPTNLERGQYAYIEARYDGRDGGEPQRRRFTIASVPYLEIPRRFQWVVRLRPQDDPRDAHGRPQEQGGRAQR